MEVAILGPLLVEDGTQPIEVGGARLRALLIRLAADPGRWVPVSALVEALWAENPPADQVNALQSLVSRLRRALPRPVLIESGPAGYRLAGAPESVDAVRFEQLAVRGRQELAAGRPEPAARVLAEALALWRGPALTEVADVPYAMAWTQRLNELRSAAIDERIEADLQLGRHRTLIAELEELTTRQPLRERSWGLRIRALSGSGRQAEALAVYEQLRRTLAVELGLDPSPELQELQLAVLQGDPALRPAPARRGPAGPARRRTNLRSPLTSFIGREHDVEVLRSLLQTSRLVTLVGPGGAGKTRLATEVAAGLDRPGGDGVWLVELASVIDPDDVPSTTLGSLGNRDTSALERGTPTHRDTLSRLVETLGQHDVLVVLDNCEHLVDAAAKLAEYLLGECPRLTVLATSREPLNIVGETLWGVRPLPAPRTADGLEIAKTTPAVHLFADRAALVRPGFAMTAENARPVTEICRRLDGLPLAIELAAARLRNLPVEAVAARLGDRFRLLTGGSRTAMPRHQTLRAVVSWSWELLTESERRLAERLCVFPGGATAGSVEAICAAESPGLADVVAADTVPELLAALTDKSLLVAVDGMDESRIQDDESRGSGAEQGEPRYRMLETIREFATEQLAARGEVTALREAHARYFLALVETAEPLLRGRDQLIWMERLTAERDNLLAAVRFAAETSDADTAVRLTAGLSWYWTLLGRHDEAATWLQLALGVPGEPSQRAYVIARVVYALSVAGAGLGMVDGDELEALLALTRSLDDPHAHPLLLLAEPASRMFHDDGAASQQAIERNLVGAEPWARAMLNLMSAMMAENDGDLELMERRLPTALAGFRETGDRWGVAHAVGTAGALASSRGDIVGAIASLEEARRMMAELHARDDESFGLARIGMLRLQLPDHVGARRDIEEAMVIADETGASAASAFARFAMAMLARREGDLGLGRRYATEALVIINTSNFLPPQIRAVIANGIAVFDLAEGDLEAARARLTEALECVRDTRDIPIAASTAVVVAELALLSGDPVRAAELLGAAVSLRGLEDQSDLDLHRVRAVVEAALRPADYRAARARGLQLTRAAALSLLEATTAGPTPAPRG